MNIFFKEKSKFISTYLTFSIITKLIPFFTLPILTHILSIEDYGLWTLFLAALMFSSPVVGFMQRSQVSRKFYNTSKIKLAQIIYNIFILSLINAVIFFSILNIVGFFVESPLLNFQNFLILSLASLFKSIIDVTTTVYRFLNKAFSFGFVELMSQGLIYVIGLSLIFIFSNDWAYLLYGLLVSYFLISLYCLYSLFKLELINTSFSIDDIKSSFKICFPLIPHAVGATVIATSDKFIIENLLSLESVAIYSTGYMLGSSSQLVIESINKVWSPYVYKQLSDLNYAKKIALIRTTYLFYLGLPLLSLVSALVAKIYLDTFLPEEYSDAGVIIYLAAFATIFRGFYVFLFPYINHIGKTHIFMYSTTISAIVNLVLTYFLLIELGLVGAVIATGVAFFIQFVIILLYTNKYFDLPWYGALKREKFTS